MEAEPYYYRGLWDEAVRAAEEALPVAWEIGEWGVVFFSSGWLAIAYLKLGQPDKARRVLDRVFNEAPARIYKLLGERDPVRADRPRSDPFDHRSTRRGPEHCSPGACRRGARWLRLEEVAAHRVLGQVHEAMGDRAEADAAFRRSLEVSTNPMSSRTRSNAVGLRPLPPGRQCAGGPGVD